MPEEYGMKVWLELAVKNVKDIKKQVQEQLKGIDLKGIADKAKVAGGQATKAAGLADSAGVGKNIGKLAMTAGAVLGILFVMKKIGDKMLAQLVKSSPYLQGILSVMGRAWMLFWRPFGDFLGHLLRPLAIALLKLSMRWLKFTRTPEGEEVVKAAGGAAIGGAAGGAIGAIVGGIAAGPIGAFIGWIVGALTGAVISLLPEAWQGVKNLFTIVTAWLDYFVKEIFGIDMNKVRESVATFMLVTVPDFFTKTLPEFFKNAVTAVGDFGSWIWDEITGATNNISTYLSGVAQWLWDEITGATSNISTSLSGIGQWLWDKITEATSNISAGFGDLGGIAQLIWDKITEATGNISEFLGGVAQWLWDKITGSLSNVGEVLQPWASWMWEKLTGALSNIEEVLQPWAGWTWDRLTESLSDTWKKLNEFSSWIWNKIIESLANTWDKLKGFSSWMWDKLAGALDNIWASLSKIGDYLYDKIREIIDRVISKISFSSRSRKNEEEYQIGSSYIPKTGMALLHKGEEVISAPRAERRGMGSSVNISNIFNISGGAIRESISEMESAVKRASRLAELELRSRGLA